MTTSNGDAAPESTSNANGAQAPQNVLMIMGQYVKDLSFECPNAPQIFTEMREPPQIAPQHGVQVNLIAQNVVEVVLHSRIEAKMNDKVAFIVELDYAALVNVPTGMSQEQSQQVLLIEVPRLIFPFARSIIADVVRDGGFPPLLLAPVEFAISQTPPGNPAESATEPAKA
ncbi:MAG: protein-export chaperone SecB [Alphaproteobacteria bacterium]|nr:MAG: protein-export chaperone SecB [Alphaproteobacteria bacterium]